MGHPSHRPPAAPQQDLGDQNKHPTLGRVGTLAPGCLLGHNYYPRLSPVLGHGERGDREVTPTAGLAILGMVAGIQPNFKLTPRMLHMDRARLRGQQLALLMHTPFTGVTSPIAAYVSGDRYRPTPGAQDAMGILHLWRKQVPH